jgi:hypothetical protein
MRLKSHLDHARSFDMRSELAKFMLGLLNDEQKHSSVSVCQEEVHADSRFLSMVNTCAEEYAGNEG